jgi:hypothetical protein
MLEILLEPGLHKTGKTDMLQNSTGLYHHKLHILCGHFALAITILMRLYECLNWHFYQSNNPNDPNARPPWQEKTRIEKLIALALEKLPEWYVNALTTLSMSGNVDLEKFEDTVEAIYW